MLDPRYGGAAPLLVQISVLQGIHIQQQRGQRRLELMGHSAYKEPLSLRGFRKLLNALLYCPGHGVEIPRQRPDLVCV